MHTGLIGSDTLTGTLAPNAGKTVGEYDITIGTLTAGDNYQITFTGAKLTITKADPEVTVPSARTNLTFTGKSQELVEAGSVKGGVMEYSLDGETWSDSIPTGYDVGKYSVWYKVSGDVNHNDTNYRLIAVNITSSTVEVPTITGKTWTVSSRRPVPLPTII